MTSPAQRGARAALDAARPAVARLDATRGPDDLAADLIDIWNAVESALRTLVGSSALAGQALIREARQRQMISFDLANSLAAFEAVYSRVQDTNYRPSDSDVATTRDAFAKLDAALLSDAPIGGSPVFDAPRQPPVSTGQAGALPMDAEPVLVVNPSNRGNRSLLFGGVAALVVVVLAVGGWALFGRNRSNSLQDGIAAYRNGQREVAVSAFNKAVRENPNDPTPHIYLARMDREVGNFSAATDELKTAITLDPSNAIALREMGANMLAKGDNELARSFYIHAIEANPHDSTSMGYLGCALMRLNRVSEGTTFLNHAGPGPWTNCQPPVASPTRASRAPATIPR